VNISIISLSPLDKPRSDHHLAFDPRCRHMTGKGTARQLRRAVATAVKRKARKG
jgi:hypothetical protein